MAGLLSNEINNTEKISVFVGECKRMGVPILPPDVNRSGLKFTPEMWEGPQRPEARGTEAALTLNAIRYGLAAVKNVGEGAMEAAIREREARGPFTTLEDFCRRLDARVANRKMLESLVKAGAFDFLGRERAELFACIEDSLAAASSAHRDRASGQVSLFDDLPPPASRSVSGKIVAWSEQEKMAFEKELLGFYVTGHPLDAYATQLSNGKFQTIGSLGELADRAQFRIAGAITQVDRKFTKKEGKPFAVVFLEDLTATLEVVIWNEVYVKTSDSLAAGRVIEIQGTLDKRDETVRATAQKVKVLSPDAQNGSTEMTTRTPAATEIIRGPIVLRIPAGTSATQLRDVRDLLASSPGTREVLLRFEQEGRPIVEVAAGKDCSIELTPELAARLQPWLAAA